MTGRSLCADCKLQAYLLVIAMHEVERIPGAGSFFVVDVLRKVAELVSASTDTTTT